jgi:hypothetical protein
MKAEILVMRGAAQRLGFSLNVAQVPETITHVNRGLFDHVYMDALFKYGVEQGKAGNGFASAPTGSVDLRTSTPQ